jgi:hypothetical protein
LWPRLLSGKNADARCPLKREFAGVLDSVKGAEKPLAQPISDMTQRSESANGVSLICLPRVMRLTT